MPQDTGSPRMIAKLSPPVADNVLLRRRLFRDLDRARRQLLTWIVGPAGSGKTTLAVSYLHTLRLPTLWYRIDAGDADLASFVYHLGLAARRLISRKNVTFPLLTPEYQGSIGVFARRFVETLSEALPRGTVLVFDDYHDVEAEAGLHDFVAAALEALPETLRVVAVSRRPPPAVFARAQAGQRMVIIDGGSLALTHTETGALARRLTKGRPCSRAALEALYASTQGWAAGITLAVARTGPGSREFGSTQVEQATFEYFTNEVFRSLPVETQDALLRLSLLPDATVRGARALTACTDIGARLDALVAARTFTVRHEGEPARYTFHPLFRSFLSARLLKTFSAERLAPLQVCAAGLLAEDGRPEQAAELLAQAEAWGPLIALIRTHGPQLLDQGRHATVAEMIERVPLDVRRKEPWLAYLFGASRFPFEADNGRAYLAEAYRGFRSNNELSGQVLTWALIVDGIAFSWVDFSPLDEWLDTAEGDLLPRFETLPPGQVQERFVAGMFSALMYRRAEDPSLPQWAQRLEKLIAQMGDPTHRILAGLNLVFYYEAWVGDPGAGRRIADLIRPRPHDPRVTSIALIAWSFTWAVHLCLRNRIDEGIQQIEVGRAEAARSGVRTWNFWLAMWAVYLKCSAGDAPGGRAYLGNIEQLITPERPLEYAHYNGLLAWVVYLEGDFVQSEALARSVVPVTERTATAVQQGHALGLLAEALVAQGRAGEALAPLRRGLHLAESIRSPMMICRVGMILAEALWQVGDHQESLALSRRVFALTRKYDLTNVPFMRGAVHGPVYARALEAGIEVETVQRLVREHRAILPPRVDYPDNWPWPLRIQTLGRFSLVVDGKVVAFSGKGQRKPIELVQLLVALGGREVKEERLTELLWPDADGDAAHSAFTTTLGRLRKLIGEKTIRVSGGRVSFDPAYCWVDTWALESLIEKDGQACAADRPDRTARILALYQGPFLMPDHDEPWATPLRERLRFCFVRYLTMRAAILSRAGRWDEAVALYQKGLDADGLAEPLHQGLIRAYLAQNRHAEAHAAFVRCRTLLSQTIGVEPTPETLALIQSIHRG